MDIKNMEDGMIKPDSDVGKKIGFTSDKFSAYSYLWKSGETVIISLIESLSRDNFKALVDRVIGLGLSVNVPNPLPNMERIVRKCGYKHTQERDPIFGLVDVWTFKPEQVKQEAQNG